MVMTAHECCSGSNGVVGIRWFIRQTSVPVSPGVGEAVRSGGRVIAGEFGRHIRHVHRQDVGDDHVVAREPILVGDGQCVGDQVADIDRAAVVTHARHEHVVEGGVVVADIEADAATGDRAVGHAQHLLAVDVDSQLRADCTHFQVIPAVGDKGSAGLGIQRRGAAFAYTSLTS